MYILLLPHAECMYVTLCVVFNDVLIVCVLKVVNPLESIIDITKRGHSLQGSKQMHLVIVHVHN